jgi:hypothetical protein
VTEKTYVSKTTPGSSRLRALAEMAVHDWIVLAYASFLLIAVLAAPAGPVRDRSLSQVGGLFTVLVVTLVLVRGRILRDGIVSPLLYRIAIYGTVQISYFFFRELLPLVNSTSLDHELHTLGELLFGGEPAILLDRYVTPATTEWFAFFYFGYFFVLAVHVVPLLFLSKNQRLVGELTFGMLFIFCVGHTLYMVVPGYGPYRAAADQFQNAFPPGLWLDVVMEAVASGGAQKDIFPSLHTAAPTLIALFSFRHRTIAPFRFTWPVMLFFSTNIIVATMFLRWHYVLDVVAGLLLATLGQALGVVVTDFELSRRRRSGLDPSWPVFALPRAANAPLRAPALAESGRMLKTRR